MSEGNSEPSIPHPVAAELEKARTSIAWAKAAFLSASMRIPLEFYGPVNSKLVRLAELCGELDPPLQKLQSRLVMSIKYRTL